MRRLPLLALAVSAAGLTSCRTPTAAGALDEPAEPSAQAPAAPAKPVPLVALPEAPPLPSPPLGLTETPGPEENPTTPEKVELGRMLFFDMRLSGDGSMACVECHRVEKAYASGNLLDGQVGGATNRRNSTSVVNLAYQTSLGWDGRANTLEEACAEMWKAQLQADPDAVARALNRVPVYQSMFIRAFGDEASAENVPAALAAFLRVLKNGDSPYDRFIAGDTQALSAEAALGLKLFQSKGCRNCHQPPLFTDDDFHNAGIDDDPGRAEVTRARRDQGKFRTPSLRNVALTAPYFHSGHVVSLDDAIALMAQGGTPNPHLDANLRPRKLSPAELRALKAFLLSLTGVSTFDTAPHLP